MATKTIPQLPAATSVVAATLFPIVNDPAGTPVTQKATGTQLDAYIRSAGGALTATTLDGSGGALTINTAQADKDVVVSSTGMVNLLFTDAGNNRVGINTATPTVALQVVGTVTATTFSGDGSALTSLPAITGFLIVAGNPATPVDANCWYNSTANTFRGSVTANVGAWAAGGALATARNAHAASIGFGSVSSVLAAGGITGAGISANTEKYNGASWSATGAMTTARCYGGGCGTASSAIASGMRNVLNVDTTQTDTYNGSTWASASSPSLARYQCGMAGASSSSGLLFGGGAATVYSSSESYNGSSWSSGGALPVEHTANGGCGSTTAALSVGGATNASPGSSTDLYIYNGSSWSTGTSLIAARGYMGVSGTTTSAMIYGGWQPTSGYKSEAYKLDGTAWSTATSLTTGRSALGGAGPSSTSAFAYAGEQVGSLSSTEIYSETMSSVSKTFTVS